jgi:hypothetical protein
MLYGEYHLSLRLSRPGRLLPWLGPALRGLVARSFKERVCRQSPAERRTRWVHCAGCPHMDRCPYGQTFEPDPPPGREVERGRDDPIRPVVLAPYYPVPADARPGLMIPLRALAVGAAALGQLPALLEALGEAGPRRGLGNDGVTFTVNENRAGCLGELGPADLPATPDALPGKVPRLGVGLTAPLFVTRPTGQQRPSGHQKRRPVGRPSLADLLRAALRSVGQLFRVYGEPLAADFSALKGAAEQVRLVDDCYEPFVQERYTSRGGQVYELQGVVGGGVYTDVPLSLLPWLLWGGRWHSGGHRVAGAGGWRLVLD